MVLGYITHQTSLYLNVSPHFLQTLVVLHIPESYLRAHHFFLLLSYSIPPPRQPQFLALTVSDCEMMSSGELLSVEPQELKFALELKKQISCSLQLLNNTESCIAFKVKTTNPKKYCVRPNTGVVLPRSTCSVMVTMQAQREYPTDMHCKDKFLLQSVIASPGATVKDISPDMFNKESGNLVQECKLRVVYVSPPQPPSPVPEGSEEGSSPRASASDNGTINTSDFTTFVKTTGESQEQSSEANALIAKLNEEKNYAIQQANKLSQELDLMKRESNKRRGGVSFFYVVLIALFGILLGYILRKT